MPFAKFPGYFKKEIYPIPTRMLLLAGLAAMFFIPLFAREPQTLRLLIMINIFSIYAVSWDLITGYTGQLVLGHGLFFGVAAYVTAILHTRLGWFPTFTILLGALAAVLTGLIAGFPALRLKGIYLGLTTMAMPVVLSGLINLFPNLTGGESGLVGLKLLAGNRLVLYYITLALMIASVFIIWKLTRSKVGLIFQAIREDEVAAQAAGVNTTYYKLLAFCISGFFAGLSGGLYAHFIRVVGPSVLSFSFSMEPIIWSIFGGVGTVFGPVVGVFVLMPVVEMLRLSLGENASMAYYVILVFVIVFASGGLMRWIIKKVEKVCPQCDTRNAVTRNQCRACSMSLNVQKNMANSVDLSNLKTRAGRAPK